MTVTLPDEMRATFERKANAAGFASVDEYVADALAEDGTFPDPGQPHFRTREELRQLLDEGMASGPPIRCDATRPSGYAWTPASGTGRPSGT